METLNGCTFDGCLLLDFRADELLSSVTVITEARYPLPGGGKNKGRLRIDLEGIRQLNVLKEAAFDADILSSRGGVAAGKTADANRVYSVGVRPEVRTGYFFELVSDFLELSITCAVCDVSLETVA